MKHRKIFYVRNLFDGLYTEDSFNESVKPKEWIAPECPHCEGQSTKRWSRFVQYKLTSMNPVPQGERLPHPTDGHEPPGASMVNATWINPQNKPNSIQHRREDFEFPCEDCCGQGWIFPVPWKEMA